MDKGLVEIGGILCYCGNDWDYSIAECVGQKRAECQFFVTFILLSSRVVNNQVIDYRRQQDF